MKISIIILEVFPELKKILITSLVFGLFLFPSLVFAYDYETHGFLSKQTTEFYNANFSEKIPSESINFLVDGSRREDDAPRWINHFYDPVYQRGYQPEIAIDAYPLVFAQILEKVVNWVSSKQWADSPSQQNRLVYKATAGVYRIASILNASDKIKLNLNSETDFSWETAKQYWLRGEKEKAMFALGHVLHLIQDASVPDHTRNDGHIGDSPYELWTSKFNLSSPDNELSQRLIGKTPVVLSNLGDYFESIAKYSNNNFYSKDTMGVGRGYQNPQPEYVGRYEEFLVGYVKDGEYGDYPLYINTSPNPFSNVFTNLKNITLISDKTGGDFIMQGYWSRLSPKAITHGAGVINLFFEEVKNEELKEQESPWYRQLWLWLVQQRNNLLGGQVLPGEIAQQGSQGQNSQESQGGGEVLQASPDSTSSPQATAEIISPTPSPATSISPSISPGPPAGGSPTPIVSLVSSPSLSSAPMPQFMSAQTPNNPTSPEPTPQSSPSSNPSPSPEISVEPSVEPSPEPSFSPEPSSTPEPSPEPSPELSPSPTPTPEISPSPEPSPTPDYQESNNQFFSDVTWYFDTELEPENGGVLTIELTVNELLPENDYHAIVAGWNSDFVLTDGAKQDGGERPVLKYNIATSTAMMIDQLAEDYGVADTLWNFNGNFSASSTQDQFPKVLKIRPTRMATVNYQWLEEEQGITREALEQKLGRQAGDDDFIALAYWPLYNNTTPSPDNIHYSGSFLKHDSEPIAHSVFYPVNQIKQVRWGVDPGAETGYSLEFEYVLPIPEITTGYSLGFELRFHLNSSANFYYDWDSNLQTPWWHGNGIQNLIYVNYGLLGSRTCDYWLRSEPKSGVRFLPGECVLNPFGRYAYNSNQLPHTENPDADSWILKVPIMLSPSSKSLYELNQDDFLTVSLWVNETGSASGLYLRQIDSRKFYFQNTYQALTPSVLPPPPPEPSRQVVINEIAWMGTASSTSDEWLELYNNSAEEIDLTGWILRSTSGPPNISLSESMPAGGYYLLERSIDDTTISDIAADLFFTGAINNPCEVLELVDNLGNVVDKTVCDGESWPAGDNATKSSIERVNPDVSGEDLSNWQTNNGIVKNGHDADGNEINGTPKQKNSSSP